MEIKIPKDSLLWPRDDAAVVGGNVLTSQRITDVVLKAFRACAASQGDMNNFTFGDDTFGYYETICGGAGFLKSSPLPPFPFRPCLFWRLRRRTQR